MPLAFLGPASAKRDTVQDRDVIFEQYGLTHDEARGVIEKDRFSKMRPRMDISVKDFRGATLEVAGCVTLAVRPAPMREPVSLDRGIAFEEKEWLQKPSGGGIALNDRTDIGAHANANVRIGFHGFDKHFRERFGGQRCIGEPCRKPEDQSLLKRWRFEYYKVE